MIVLGLMLLFFALDFAAVFVLEGLSHLTGAWPWFIPLAVAFVALPMIYVAIRLDAGSR